MSTVGMWTALGCLLDTTIGAVHLLSSLKKLLSSVPALAPAALTADPLLSCVLPGALFVVSFHNSYPQML